MLSSITRYPGGVNNVGPAAGLADLRVPSPLIYNMMTDDFNAYTPGDWTVAGTAVGSAALLAATDGGIVDLVTTATNPSESSMAFGAPNLTFTPDILKDLIVASRVRLDDATLGGFLFGLGAVATSPLGASPANGIYFRKLTGTFTPQLILRIGGVDVAVVTAPINMASGVWYDLVIAYTAADGALRGFVNNGGVRLATNPASLGTAPLSLLWSVRNSTAAIRTLSIDNYLVAKAR